MKNTVFMEQVHGNNIVVVSTKDGGRVVPNCDGLVTSDPNLKLAVRTADCLPIGVIDRKGHIHGIIHAGWRGLQKKIIKNAIESINRNFGVKAIDLNIFIGPHICVDHYEIKEDVAGFFPETISKGGKKLLDLAEVASNQFISMGVQKENISIDGRCTFEDKNLSSYRRDKNFHELNIQIG